MPRTAVPVRWAVQEVVRIRAESGCLRPGEDVAGQRSVFLVVVRAKHGRRHRTVALATSGSEPACSTPDFRRSGVEISEKKSEGFYS